MSEEKKALSPDELEDVAGGMFVGRPNQIDLNEVKKKVEEFFAKLPTLEELNSLITRSGQLPLPTLEEAKAWVRKNFLVLMSYGLV